MTMAPSLTATTATLLLFLLRINVAKSAAFASQEPIVFVYENESCIELIMQRSFSGDCCSLSDRLDGCQLSISNGFCNVGFRELPPCDMEFCQPPVTDQFTSFSEISCPPSDYNPFDTESPTSTPTESHVPSMAPSTQFPSMLPSAPPSTSFPSMVPSTLFPSSMPSTSSPTTTAPVMEQGPTGNNDNPATSGSSAGYNNINNNNKNNKWIMISSVGNMIILLSFVLGQLFVFA